MSIALPSIRASSAATAVATIAPVRPAVRRATSIVPVIAAAFTSPTPSATPVAPPNRRTGIARMSNSSGPGWLRSLPAPSDADDQVPSSGKWSRLNTSRARISTSALSPIGIHLVPLRRATAVAIGSSAIASTTHSSRAHTRASRSVRPTLCVVPATLEGDRSSTSALTRCSPGAGRTRPWWSPARASGSPSAAVRATRPDRAGVRTGWCRAARGGCRARRR